MLSRWLSWPRGCNAHAMTTIHLYVACRFEVEQQNSPTGYEAAQRKKKKIVTH